MATGKADREVRDLIQRLFSQGEIFPRRLQPPVNMSPGYLPVVRHLRVARAWEDRGQIVFLLTWETDRDALPWISHYRIMAVDTEPPSRLLADVERPGTPAVVPLDLPRSTAVRFIVQTVMKNGQCVPIDRCPVVSCRSPEPRWRAIVGDASALHYPAGFALEVGENRVGFIAHRTGGGAELALRDGTMTGGIDGQGTRVAADGYDGSVTAYLLRLMQTPSGTAGAQAGYVTIHLGGTAYKVPIYQP